MTSDRSKELSAAPRLEGFTVLITRGRAQSAEMTSLLEGFGARVINCPMIEIREPESWEALDGALRRLGGYDWLVFTSANGVEFFFRRLAETGACLPARLKTCAIGPATARAFGGRAGVDLVAKDSKAEGALAALIDHLGLEKIRGLRFLIPRARVARETLPDELRALGAEVETVETYRTTRPEMDGESIKRLLTESEIHAITFTSSSTVSNFAAIVGMHDLSPLLEGKLVACIGPITAATAREHGLKKIIQPEVYTAAALVEALIDAAGRG